jgi:hypothetical protein
LRAYVDRPLVPSSRLELSPSHCVKRPLVEPVAKALVNDDFLYLAVVPEKRADQELAFNALCQRLLRITGQIEAQNPRPIEPRLGN